MGNKFRDRTKRVEENLTPVRYGERIQPSVVKTNWHHGEKGPQLRELIYVASRRNMFVREHEYSDRPSTYTVSEYRRDADPSPRVHYRERVSFDEALRFLESAP